MSNLQDFNSYKATIDAEIAREESEIAGREEQIGALEQQNDTSRQRITILRGVEGKVAAALEALQDAGPILAAPPPVVDGTGEKKKRPKLKKMLPLIIEGAGAIGITIDEIVELVRTRDQIELNPGSLRSYLYTARRGGGIEKNDDERWRCRVPLLAAPAAIAAISECSQTRESNEGCSWTNSWKPL